MRITYYGIVFFIFLSFQLKAQVNIDGIIFDNDSKQPLPYTNILIKHSDQGAISNSDGHFRLKCAKTDTLIISFISYETKELPCSYFLNNQYCFLQPLINELKAVSVYASYDYLFDLLLKARKKMMRSNDIDSKTYFSLETSSETIPVEILECYFNAKIHPNGIKKLKLKNGRIGMSANDSNFFVSLNTTRVISGYNLLYKSNNKFPGNPLQLTKSRLKKDYFIELIDIKNDIYKLKFIPKKDSNDFFISTIWIDNAKEQIIKIKLFKNNLLRYPFVAIDPSHSIDTLNYQIAYTFTNDSAQTLLKIEFQYDMHYSDHRGNRNMESKGVFLFYDMVNLFELPFYSNEDASLTDYDKIMAQPYNPKFWEYNEVVIPSKKAIRYRKFFDENGVLLNYGQLSKSNPIFNDKIIPWSKKRLFLNDINGDYTKTSNLATSNDFHASVNEWHKMLAFSYQLFLDRNTYKDKAYYLAETLISSEKSFYFLNINKNTTAFINLYFDLVEIEKRNMVLVLENHFWNKHQVDSIYDSTIKNLDNELDEFLKSVDYGENEKALWKYIEKVDKRLQVNNGELIIDKEFLSDITTNPMADLYNYGSLLLKSGKYEQSLEILLKAYDMGDTHPWLLYNLGAVYLKTGDKEKACWFFKKSEESGGVLEEEVLNICVD